VPDTCEPGHRSFRSAFPHSIRKQARASRARFSRVVRAALCVTFAFSVGCDSMQMGSEPPPETLVEVLIVEDRGAKEVEPVVLRLPLGFVRHEETRTTLLVVEALYPSMKFFRPEDRDAWYRKKPDGTYGAHTQGVIRIILSRLTGHERGVLPLFESDLKSNLLSEISEPIDANPAYEQVSVYANHSPGLGENPRTVLLKATSGRATVISCGGVGNEICTARTTWRDSLRVSYHVSRTHLPRFADVDLRVQQLLDTFGP
jgi:hypothetical protein